VDTIVQDVSTTAVVPALEANMVAFWALYGRTPGAELYETEELLRFVTGLDEPLFNAVLRAHLTPATVDSAIATTLAEVGSRRVPMIWWVGPSTRPADLALHLERHGFTHADDNAAMALDLRSLSEEPPSIPAGLVVTPVEDLETLRTWTRVVAIGMDLPERVHDDFVALEVSLGLEPPGHHYTRYIAYQDGVAVATSGMLLHAGVAGIFAVATLAEARRRGIGTALTLVPLLEARRRGYRVGTLQATPMGFPVYKRLGFREVCRPIELYLWSP
jgi:GNAT superfamily N-acetyltransferase